MCVKYTVVVYNHDHVADGAREKTSVEYVEAESPAEAEDAALALSKFGEADVEVLAVFVGRLRDVG